jgi:hypothetical protein
MLSIFGSYALNVLHDPNLALRAWQRAAQLEPGTVQYQVTLAKMLIASAQLEKAASHVENVRRLGRLGQNEQIARELERLAAQARIDQLPRRQRFRNEAALPATASTSSKIDSSP